MFWADSIVEEVIQKRKPPFKVYDWWTPSGMPTAGHIRTILLHQAIYQGLKIAGNEATYFYGFDDMDPMDGLPSYLPEEFRQYMGIPLYRIPSPYEGYKSFADYFSCKYLEAMEDLEIYPEVPKTSELYENGTFNEAITIALDNAEKIRAIYADLGAERPGDWYPFQPICEKCGKIGTTYVYDWDGERVSYRCEPKLVEWAQGCGNEGQISPYNGNGKMHWKVEWPSKWFIFNPDYEGGGKDHFTKNSSRDYGRRIVSDVFNTEEPVGYAHEFFLVGGKKISSSKGLGMTANDAAHILPPHIMRFFVYRIPLNRHLEFSPEGDTIPRIFDEYDRGLAAINTDPESNEARALVYSHQSDEPLPQYTMRFSKVTFLIQMPHIDIKTMAENEKGSPLTDSEACELEIRIEYARRWLQSFAPEEAKFELQPELPKATLTDEQKVYLARVQEALQSAEWNGEAVHTILHDVKNDMQLAPKNAFCALYLIFLNKPQGPQAGWFLAALDKGFVLSRLQEATHSIGE
jgi:lysyl-tRNA synthetase, class I